MSPNIVFFYENHFMGRLKPKIVFIASICFVLFRYAIKTIHSIWNSRETDMCPSEKKFEAILKDLKYFPKKL